MDKKKYDYLIVGAGWSGAVLAERLSSIGKKILVIDKRDHIGGNCFDVLNEKGILIHRYGPHYFRTSSFRIMEYLSNFTSWILHRYKVKANINGKLYTLPINRNTLNQFFGINLKTDEETKKFLESKKEKIKIPKNAEEQVLALVGKEIYESFFKNYTIKQWGIHPKKLDPSITARIPIRTNTNDDYINEIFQGMPKKGYNEIFKKLLKNVDLKLNTDFEDIKDKIDYKNIIYTGRIDEFFGFKFGKLPYRSINFKFETYPKEFYQEVAQINYPNEQDFTRIVEIKHVTKQKSKWTTISKEYPCEGNEPFYPIINDKNKKLYQQYRKEADKLDNVYFVGRLAQYKYLNMDHVIKGALDLFESLKNT